MTHRRSWKKVEQRIAEKLGGRRVPLSGENSGHGTKADVLDVPEYVEIKMQVDATCHADLMKLNKTARRYDKTPLVFYDAVEGPTWAGLWLDAYTEGYRGEHGEPRIGGWHAWKASQAGFLLSHELGKRLPHRALVEDTIMKAQDEGKPPLVVIQKKGSPKPVALVPMEVPA